MESGTASNMCVTEWLVDQKKIRVLEDFVEGKKRTEIAE